MTLESYSTQNCSHYNSIVVNSNLKAFKVLSTVDLDYKTTDIAQRKGLSVGSVGIFQKRGSFKIRQKTALSIFIF